jgi:hypothetical protein
VGAAVKPFVLALALVAVLAAAGTQPAAARDSSGIVGITNLGSGERESWVFIANEPPECLVVFLHAAGRPVPAPYIAWLDYLAGAMSCAVIFPRYQVSPAAPSSLAGLRAAVSAGVVHVRNARYGFERIRGRTTLRTVVVGVGLGGSLAFYYAANAKRWGLPVPVAVDSIFPTPGHVAGLPLPRIARSIEVLVQVSGDRRAEEQAAAADLRRYLGPHPAAHKRTQVVRSSPGLKASEASTLRTTAAAEATFWTPLDALIDGSG